MLGYLQTIINSIGSIFELIMHFVQNGITFAKIAAEGVISPVLVIGDASGEFLPPVLAGIAAIFLTCLLARFILTLGFRG